jgi:hypothetical protein
LLGLDLTPGRVRNGTRLFSRIAQLLQSLDGLPALRQRVAAGTVAAEQATSALVRLVGVLLAVVFEATDAATDPAVLRALVAQFNFMQGKEYAGQERALGARAFTSGRLDPDMQARWLDLVDAQARCLQIFQDLTEPALAMAWRSSDAAAQALAAIERLRAAAQQDGAPLLSLGTLNLPWYEACTARMDAMKTLEDALSARLRSLCAERIERARAELRDQRATLDALQRGAESDDTVGPPGYGPHLERAMVDLLAEQSQRMQRMGDDLDAARAALRERKLVERAKGLLMSSEGLDEESAYRRLRRQAMDGGLPLHELARRLIDSRSSERGAAHR